MLITLDKITKSFKSSLFQNEDLILKNISFSIDAEKFYGFLGPNGAGKTTTIKILMGILKQSEGSIHFGEAMGKSKNDFLQNVGFLPERPYFYQNLTGEEFLFFLGQLNSISKKELQKQIEYWSKKLNINYALKKLIRSYSKGMLQRLGMVSTLLHNPKLIVLDEPLSGLDPIGRREFKEVLRDVYKEGKTIFMSSHIVPDIEEVCSEVIFLKDGVIQTNGPIDQLLNDKANNTYLIQVKAKEDSIKKLTIEFTDIKYQKQGEEIYTIEIPGIELNEFLQKLILVKIEVLQVQTKRVGLEEIFYYQNQLNNELDA